MDPGSNPGGSTILRGMPDNATRERLAVLDAAQTRLTARFTLACSAVDTSTLSYMIE